MNLQDLSSRLDPSNGAPAGGVAWRTTLEWGSETRLSARFGVPVPAGGVAAGCDFRLTRGGQHYPCQSSVLEQWPDGSARWVLIDAVVPDQSQNSGTWWLEAGDFAASAAPAQALATRQTPAAIEIAAEHWTAAFSTFQTSSLLQIVADERVLCDGRLQFTDRRQTRHTVMFETAELECTGPQRAVVRLEGAAARGVPLRVTARVSILGSEPAVHVEVTLHNPRRATHRGGLWDLGDSGSILFQDLSLLLDASGLDATAIRCGMEDSEGEQQAEQAVSIYQDSSGGENWDSRLHVNRYGKTPCQFRGYRMAVDTKVFHGDRAEPRVSLVGAGGELHIAPPEFWQQFPKCLEATPAELRFGMFPGEWSDLHELQGGERKSHGVRIEVVAAGGDRKAGRHSNADDPPVRANVLALVRGEVLPELRNVPADALRRFDIYLEECLAKLLANRERVDEYGWRSYGDIHADHEELHYHGEQPQVSHYNNQFDMVQGFLLQYLRTGQQRWWELGDALARHVLDIDLYHTTEDKAAYNGGLFWFTDHYLHAYTSTHRTYSKHNLPPKGPYGGGPSAQHNFTSGLLLYHHLTGSPAAREAVLQLADWVVAMDDGRRTIFRFLDDGPTGMASATADGGYHGPGRGAGNSLNALLDGWRLSGERKYLQKAEELLRRCIHPHDDIDARNLPDVEHRWSYTVFLTALAKYLQLKAGAQTDAMYAYGRASLLHYATWMLEHERPFFDQAEKLEFPTEAWAAQEFRKANVLRLASAYAEEPLATRIFERGGELADRAWSDLLRFKTRTTARAMAIVMTEGLWDAGFRSQRPSDQPPGPTATDFGAPESFVPQKHRVKSILRSPRGFAVAFGRLLNPSRWQRNTAEADESIAR